MSFTFNWVSTPGQNNSFVNGSVNGGGRARAFLDDGNVDPFNSPLYICIPPITFQGGDIDAVTLYDFARTIATCGIPTTVQNPAINYNGNRLSTGGAFTLNGNPCGRYEYNVLAGGTTLTQAMVATLFSSSLDISTWIVVRGNLTIGSGVTLIPNVNPSYTAPATFTSPDPDAKRRLFMVVYVTGTLAFADGTSIISMTACGGNSSPQGANIVSFNVPIANNLYYGEISNLNVEINSTGGIGGTGVSNSTGENGSGGIFEIGGSPLYTAGGGSGNSINGQAYSGTGGQGSPFSGGPGGGSSSGAGATAGSSQGGGGGGGGASSEDGGTVGGTGNPGGNGSSASGFNGTGGVVVVITEGSFDTGGNIKANGVDAQDDGTSGGGASGGGLIVLIQSLYENAFLPTLEVIGGTAQYGGGGGSGQFNRYGINS
jgi:hypothetical protein